MIRPMPWCFTGTYMHLIRYSKSQSMLEMSMQAELWHSSAKTRTSAFFDDADCSMACRPNDDALTEYVPLPCGDDTFLTIMQSKLITVWTVSKFRYRLMLVEWSPGTLSSAVPCHMLEHIQYSSHFTKWCVYRCWWNFFIRPISITASNVSCSILNQRVVNWQCYTTKCSAGFRALQHLKLHGQGAAEVEGAAINLRHWTGEEFAVNCGQQRRSMDTKTAFGRGSAPDPAGGAQDAPHRPLI